MLAGGGRVTLGDHGFDVPIELERTRRTDVPQPQIEQRIGYFAGEWTLVYTGGEFPPVTFTVIPHGPFVLGHVTGGGIRGPV